MKLYLYPHDFGFVDLSRYPHHACKYCGQIAENYYAGNLKESIFYRKSCISDEEKIIKDIIE